MLPPVLIESSYHTFDDGVAKSPQRDFGHHQKYLWLLLHQVAHALKLKAEFLKCGDRFAGGASRRFAEFLAEVLHNALYQLFFRGEVVKEGCIIDARLFRDLLVTQTFEA